MAAWSLVNVSTYKTASRVHAAPPLGRHLMRGLVADVVIEADLCDGGGPKKAFMRLVEEGQLGLSSLYKSFEPQCTATTDVHTCRPSQNRDLAVKLTPAEIYWFVRCRGRRIVANRIKRASKKSKAAER